MQRRQMALQRAFPATSDRKEVSRARVLRPPPSRRPNSNIDFLVYSLTIVVHLDVFLLAIVNKKSFTFLFWCFTCIQEFLVHVLQKGCVFTKKLIVLLDKKVLTKIPIHNQVHHSFPSLFIDNCGSFGFFFWPLLVKMYTFLIIVFHEYLGLLWRVHTREHGSGGVHVVSRFGVQQEGLVSRGVYSRKGK